MKAATKTDVKKINKRIDELSKCLTEMSDHMKDYSHWLAYRCIKDTFQESGNLVTPKFAHVILTQARGHVTFILFKTFFKKIGVKGFE